MISQLPREFADYQTEAEAEAESEKIEKFHFDVGIF